MTDRLAAVRTHLANERTLLAYLRTGLALLVGSITANHFVDDDLVRQLASSLGTVGAVALAFGIWRFLQVRRLIQRLEKTGD